MLAALCLQLLPADAALGGVKGPALSAAAAATRQPPPPPPAVPDAPPAEEARGGPMGIGEIAVGLNKDFACPEGQILVEAVIDAVGGTTKACVNFFFISLVLSVFNIFKIFNVIVSLLPPYKFVKFITSN